MPSELKCLSLWQPWASLVAELEKWIETRHWSTAYRGRLGIHAARRRPRPGFSAERGWATGYGRLVYADHVDESFTLTRIGTNDTKRMPLGALVATCTLTDVVPIVDVMTGAGPEDHDASRLAVYDLPEGGLELVDRHKGMDDVTRMRDIADQRPFGDFTPGRYAWLLGDVQPTSKRCPVCWGDGDDPTGGPCPVCVGRGICDPVPVLGRQGLFNLRMNVTPASDT